MRVRTLLLLGLLVAVMAVTAAAHPSRVVGPYRFTVAMRVEPPYTGEPNGVDLLVRAEKDNSPVEGLEKSLFVELTAPDGQRRQYDLRPKHGEPGRYVTDWVLTQPGVYRIRIFGFAGGQPVDETFESQEVRPIDELRFAAGTSGVEAEPAPPVQVMGAWARPAVAMLGGGGHSSHDAHGAAGMGATSAVYMTLVNAGDQPLALVGVRTAVARAVELHETRVEGQIARMRPVQRIEIPARGRVELRPGGLHVMLLGLQRDLNLGDRFPVTLTFEGAGEVSVEVEVRLGGS